MKPAVRAVLLSVSGIVAGILLLAACALAFLQTPSGSEFLLARAKAALAAKGIQLSYKEARIKLFSSIRFLDLKIMSTAGPGQLNATVNALDADYSISIIRRSVRVTRLKVDGPSIVLRSHTDAKEKPAGRLITPASPASSTAGSGDWLRKPLVSLSIAEVALKNLKLDLDYDSEGLTLMTAMEKLNLEGSVEFLAGHFSSSGKLELGAGNRIAAGWKNGASRWELQTVAGGSAHWNGSISSLAEGLAIQFQPSEVKLDLQEVVLDQDAPGSSLHARLDRARLESHGHLLARRGQVDSLELRSRLEAGLLAGNRARNGIRSDFGFSSHQVTLDSDIGPDVTEGIRLKLAAAFVSLADGAALLKPSNLAFSTDAVLSRNLQNLKARTSARLHGAEFLNWGFTAQGGLGTWTIQSDADVLADERWAGIVPGGEVLRQTGAVKAVMKLQANLAGRALTSAFTGDLTLDISQSSKPSTRRTIRFEPWHARAQVARAAAAANAAFEFKLDCADLAASGVRASGLQLAMEGEQSEKGIQGKFKGSLPTMLTPPFKKPISTTLEGSVSWDHSSNSLKTGNSLDVRSEELGSWKAITEFEADPLRSGGGSTLTQLKPGTLSHGKFSVSAPVSATYKLELNPARQNFQLEASAPSLEFPAIGKAVDSRISLKVGSDSLFSARDLDIDVGFKQARFSLDQALSSRAPTLSGLNLDLSATLREGDRVTVRKFVADLNRSMIWMTAEATGKWKRKEFQTRGMVVAQVPKGFPEIAHQSIQGQIDFPWTLSVLRGRDITFEGNLKLIGLAWSRYAQRVSGVSGSIPVSEKLIWDGRKVRFASLITQNPFERVNYDRLRPLIESASQVRIEKIGLEEKSYGPFVGYFSMNQNMIFAHQFDFGLGTHGKAYGEIYFDVYPSNLQLGVLTRLTGLDLGELLPARYLVRAPQGDKKLSARSGLVVNLNKASVDGRVDVTEIGGSQLITLINVLDPRYEDEKMNRIRAALGVGYPTFVEMAFQNGYLSLGMDLSVLGVRTHFDVRGIPIYTQVSSLTEGVVKKTQEGLLK